MLLRAVYGHTLKSNRNANAKNTQGTRTEHVRLTYKGTQKRIGMHIIFCVRPAISDAQSARKGIAQRTYATPAVVGTYMFKIPYRPKFIYCGMRHIDTKACHNISSLLHIKGATRLTIYFYLI